MRDLSPCGTIGAMIALTAAERKRRERAEHKRAGRVPVTVHVLPEYREDVRRLEARLRKKEPKREG